MNAIKKLIELDKAIYSHLNDDSPWLPPIPFSLLDEAKTIARSIDDEITHLQDIAEHFKYLCFWDDYFTTENKASQLDRYYLSTLETLSSYTLNYIGEGWVIYNRKSVN